MDYQDVQNDMEQDLKKEKADNEKDEWEEDMDILCILNVAIYFNE